MKTISALHKVSELTLELRDVFRNNDLSKFESILREGWEQKKQFAKNITTKKIDSICHTVELCGSKAMKVTGQGGGGHLFVYAEKKKHPKIIKNLKKLGIPHVNFKYHNTNSTVQNLSD
jgi:galactokinase/mevalonate kinase-like predicted kinase